MRISDWSSDVCSSDLGRSVGSALADGVAGTQKNVLPIGLLAVVAFVGVFVFALVAMLVILLLAAIGGLVHPVLAMLLELGRGSWRERVCQYVYISVVAVPLQQQIEAAVLNQIN